VTMKQATGVAGTAVREARINAGLTSTALGAASGMSKSAISAIETGRSNPTVDTLERIAAALNTDLVIVFFDRSASAAA